MKPTIDPGRFDQAVLSPSATASDVRDAARRCVGMSVRGLCVGPARARVAAEALGSGSATRLVVVAGFPGAHASPESIRREAEGAVEDGAGEIDLVLPSGRLIEGDLAGVAREARHVVRAVAPAPVKLIVEVSLIDDALLRSVVDRVVAPSGAAFLKTGTGVYGSRIAVPRIRRIRGMLPIGLRLKVAGGIRDRRSAETALGAGADVVGTSATFAILVEERSS